MALPPSDPVGGAPTSHGPFAERPASAAARRSSAPLALAALIVCVAAFVLGLLPLLGATLAATGIVLVTLAVRRGIATKRTYAAGAAAVVGGLASIVTTVALVGLVAAPSSPSAPEPTVAAGEMDGADGGDAGEPTEVDSAPDGDATGGEADPAAEADGPAEKPAVDPETTAAPEPGPTEDPEPTEETAAATVPPADLGSFEELDERGLSQIVKAPDDHIGRQVVVYGAITQLDAATGKCFVRLSISHAPQGQRYDYEHNTVGLAGDGVSDCPVLDPFVTDDEVKLWVTIGGSLSYDTQIGGSTTVPVYLIHEVELL